MANDMKIPEGLTETEALLQRAFELASDASRHMALGYEAGWCVELRAIHDAMPLFLHREDCDGCAAGVTA